MKITIRRPRSKNFLMTVDMSDPEGVAALREVQRLVREINSYDGLTRTQVATKPVEQRKQTYPRRTETGNLVGNMPNAKLVDVYLYERAIKD